MRSHYDDFAVDETNKLSSNYNNNFNSNIINNGAIPYHARENSLPFSYGQITSTPLRPTNSTSTSTSASLVPRNSNKNARDLDFDFDFGLGLNYAGRTKNSGGNYDYNNGYGKSVLTERYASIGDSVKCHNHYIYDDLNASEKYLNDICTQTVQHNSANNINNKNKNCINNNTSETDASMIKTQPRLTSPLLVRKTLSNGCSNSSRSPTRSTTNTNTIANTYHYSYGNSNSNKNANNSIGDNNYDKFGLNGNFNSSNENYDHKTIYGNGSSGNSIGDALTKTPPRHDFDELLRERREKVFNEYRSTTHDLTHNSSTLSPKVSPVPPPRRFANGTVQLPSTLPPSLNHKSLSTPSSLYPAQTPLNRSQSQSSRYNYDIEFNLNLNECYATEDEVDNVNVLRRRTNTIHSSLPPQRPPQPQQFLQKQQQQQLYQTRDIPLVSSLSSSSYVERNYHTISSSSELTHAIHNNNYSRETLSPTSMLDIYATPYDDERINKRTNTMLPLEANTSPATATLQRLQRSTEYATYGNGKMFGHELTNLGETMTDRESTSPIYATSTKKATSVNGNSNTSYRNATLPQTTATISTTTYTVADYQSPTSGRPETPAFPVTPRTPFATQISNTATSSTILNRSANGNYQQQQQLPSTGSNTANVEHYITENIYGSNYRPRLNSSLSMANSEPQEVAAHLVKFAKDSSKFWYKPNLSREEAIALLINASPGTFVVRDSTTYKNAYGLVLRVAQPPPGSVFTGKPDELVRHFLIEPTTRGVRLKGCANEPVFTSLSALVYEHSINQLALPCLLHIPERDLVPPLVEPTPAQKQLMTQGAACNVLWLFSCDTESLTGEEAIRKAIRQMYALPTPPTPTEVHFKVTQQGITLTDNTRRKFFRKHYTADIISYCAIDPDHRLWSMEEHDNDNSTVVGSLKKTIFAFVARRSPSSKDNQCHIFCDLAINQPASAIVSFVNKTLPTEKQKNYVL